MGKKLFPKSEGALTQECDHGPGWLSYASDLCKTK